MKGKFCCTLVSSSTHYLAAGVPLQPFCTHHLLSLTVKCRQKKDIKANCQPTEGECQCLVHTHCLQDYLLHASFPVTFSTLSIYFAQRLHDGPHLQSSCKRPARVHSRLLLTLFRSASRARNTVKDSGSPSPRKIDVCSCRLLSNKNKLKMPIKKTSSMSTPAAVLMNSANRNIFHSLLRCG
jgi:hypothetical protein